MVWMLALANMLWGELIGMPPEAGVPFNGYSSYAVVRNAEAFNFSALTVSAWVKVRSKQYSQVFLNRGAAGGLFTFYLYDDNMRMLIEYEPGKYAHAKAPLPPLSTWTRYTGTYDGVVIKAYMNGELQEITRAPGRIPPSDAELYIGALSPDERFLDGWLEDICIWSRALSDTEVKALSDNPGAPELGEGLTARWTVRSLQGTTWRNQVITGPDAEYYEDPKAGVSQS